ncbi:hypothetical protein [Maricaulis parjimensis]|uniref:hypothetical protein n=1 Tax=Maricaulis parjimensis TaxID=144023 RepID=UPI00193936CE|nr:hypothetical protein [Maricaulis parjimensis]
MSNYSPFQPRTQQQRPLTKKEALDEHAEFMKKQRDAIAGIEADMRKPDPQDEEARELLGLPEDERDAVLKAREEAARQIALDTEDVSQLLDVAALKARVKILDAEEFRARKKARRSKK